MESQMYWFMIWKHLLESLVQKIWCTFSHRNTNILNTHNDNNPVHNKMYETLIKLWRVILKFLWRKGFLHLHNNLGTKTCIVLKGERKWRLGKYIKFKNIIASFVLQLRMRGFHQTGYLKPNKMARNSLMMPHHCFRQVIFEVR